MRTALIVVDVQNDFAHPDGSLYVAGAPAVIESINSLEPHFDDVVFTKDYHPLKTNHFESDGGPWPKHCVAGTWGAKLHKDLHGQAFRPVVLKGTEPNEDGYSGFSVARGDGSTKETGLDGVLQILGVRAVVIVGLALDVCVKATALDAVELGYYTTVLHHATAPVTEAGGRKAVHELRTNGVII